VPTPPPAPRAAVAPPPPPRAERDDVDDPPPPPPPKAAGAETPYKRALTNGQRLLDDSQFDAAIAAFKLALASNARGDAALVGMAKAYYEKNDDEKAFDHLKRAVKMNPNNAEAYLHLGTIYGARGDKAEARKAFERCLFLQPTGPAADDARLLLKRL
jgi:tetratricopeptide (TPR) repeat protein